MKKLFSHIANKLLPGVAIMWVNFKTLAFNYGQWESVRKGMAVDKNGLEIPWYTYPTIEYLKSFDFQSCDVFEFGSGNSSFYWANRARSVVSVEDNKEWFEIVNNKKRLNQSVIYYADQVCYVKSLADQNKLFEIVVIDGNWRMQCTLAAIKYLKPDGMIVLDNSDRVIEKKCCELLRQDGFIQIDFSGFGPINDYCWTTSIFMKTASLLQKNFSNASPIGGLGN